MTRVLISAGDASGDRHAAEFVSAARRRNPDMTFFGLGGEEMREAGAELLVHQREIAIGGLVEVVRGARRVISAWHSLTAAARDRSPDLVVLVDSGGFNLPLARRLRRLVPAPILYYVAPQVWAWRRGRIKKLARRVDRLAVIFPFEPEFYAGCGLPVDYVGHPLIDGMTESTSRPDREEARRSLGLDADAPVIAVFPGSRSNEVRHQLPVQLAAIELLHARAPRSEFLIALAPTVSRGLVDGILARFPRARALPLKIVEGRSREVMVAADVGLAKPGTTTLELALLERPMVVIGRTSALTAAVVRRAVKLPSLAMPNLIAGAPIVPEFLQEKARPQDIADAVERLLAGPERDRQLRALYEVVDQLGSGGAAQRAAAIAEEMLETARA